jgi:single-strand DNA-binding protein
MLNKATLIGRLTRDPEVRYTGSNIPVARFTLAVNRNFKNKDGEYEADFIPVVVWRRLAELCQNYVFKGNLIAVHGRIQVSSYDAKDGTKRYTTEVIADDIVFLERKADRAGGGGGSYERNDAAMYEKEDSNYGIPVDGFNPVDDDDDLPF